jgi:hypothetical protein
LIVFNRPVGDSSPTGAAIRPGFYIWELEMSFFRMVMGRFEIVATSGVKNGSVRVPKSEAEAYDVVDRDKRLGVRVAQQGVTLDTAWFYCVRRHAGDQGVTLLH